GDRCTHVATAGLTIRQQPSHLGADGWRIYWGVSCGSVNYRRANRGRGERATRCPGNRCQDSDGPVEDAVYADLYDRSARRATPGESSLRLPAGGTNHEHLACWAGRIRLGNNGSVTGNREATG